MWVPIDQRLLDGPEMARWERTTGQPATALLGHLTALWLWATAYADGGELPADPFTIAKAARWVDDPDALVVQLVAAGLLVELEEGDGYQLAYYDDLMVAYHEKAETTRQKTKERVRAHRERRKAEKAGGVTVTKVLPSVTVTPGNVLVTPPVTNVTPHNTTQHSTQQHSTTPDRARALNGSAGELVDLALWDGQREAFAAFQDGYPKLVTAALWPLFRDAVPDEREWSALLAGLQLWMECDQWQEDLSRYPPAAEKFLKEQRWRKPPKPTTRGSNAQSRTANNHRAAAQWRPGASILSDLDDDTNQ